MTIIFCDRCESEIEYGDERQLTLNSDPGGNMEELCADICPPCVEALRRFLTPAGAAPSPQEGRQ